MGSLPQSTDIQLLITFMSRLVTVDGSELLQLRNSCLDIIHVVHDIKRTSGLNLDRWTAGSLQAVLDRWAVQEPTCWLQ
jgi:hypothetical protein